MSAPFPEFLQRWRPRRPPQVEDLPHQTPEHEMLSPIFITIGGPQGHVYSVEDVCSLVAVQCRQLDVFTRFGGPWGQVTPLLMLSL